MCLIIGNVLVLGGYLDVIVWCGNDRIAVFLAGAFLDLVGYATCFIRSVFTHMSLPLIPLVGMTGL